MATREIEPPGLPLPAGTDWGKQARLIRGAVAQVATAIVAGRSRLRLARPVGEDDDSCAQRPHVDELERGLVEPIGEKPLATAQYEGVDPELVLVHEVVGGERTHQRRAPIHEDVAPVLELELG